MTFNPSTEPSFSPRGRSRLLLREAEREVPVVVFAVILGSSLSTLFIPRSTFVEEEEEEVENCVGSTDDIFLDGVWWALALDILFVIDEGT